MAARPCSRAARVLCGAALVLLLAAAAQAQPFTNIQAGLDGAFFGAAAWGDMDGDGDLDLAYTGSGPANARLTRLYRNDDGAFVPIAAGLPDVGNGALAWGDVDNDGDLDLLLMGIDPQFASVGDVYRNDGGVFTALGLGLPRVDGSVSWADFDNDGDLDILLAGFGLGAGADGPLLYRNDGAGVFTPVAGALERVNGSDGAWGDFDSDGDLDLALVGLSATSGPFAAVYRNDGLAGTDSLALVDVGAGLTGLRDAAVAWGDYDGDGDFDLAVTGRAATANAAQVYRNDGNGTFTDIGAGVEGLRWGDAAWGDYDADGDLDLAVTGRTNSFQNVLSVYTNTQGAFTDAGLLPDGLFTSSLAWGDYDNDGDLDLFAMGSPDGALASAAVYRNDGGTPNTTPTAPSGLLSGINGTSLTLVWDPASDAQTPAAGLTYNLRVGTTPGGSEVVAPMALGSGLRQVAQFGNVQQNRLWTIHDIDTTRTYYWTVQAVDNGFRGSAFAPEQIVEPKPGLIVDSSFVEIDFGLAGLAASDAAWADYDGDGDLDFAVTGGAVNAGFTHVYRNDNGAAFTQVGGNLLGVLRGALAWEDVDRDGDLDLLVSGQDNALDPQTRLFRNDGGDTFTPLAAGLTPVSFGSADWADADHDGDPDLLLTGQDGGGAHVAQVFRNNDGTFADLQAGLDGVRFGDGIWLDWDDDGNFDFITAGENNDGFELTRLYENRDGAYRDVFAALPGIWTGDLDVADLDQDGDLDLALCGARADFDPTPQDAQPLTAVYRNDGGPLNAVGSAFKAVSRCALDWGDYDSDGDPDLLLTGFDGVNTIARIYRNDADGFREVDPQIEPVIDGAVQWGDYDRDGRLDILLTGQNSATLPVTRIYRNTAPASNTPPQPPTAGFAAATDGAAATLSWGAGSDAETPTDGLTYTLRVGTTPGGTDLLSPNSLPDGRRRLARRGNVEHHRQWTIRNLPRGRTIYWSVQAVDHHDAGSAFSAEQTFETTGELFFTEAPLAFPGLSDGDAEWGDYDADGDLDLVILGEGDDQLPHTHLYRNDNGLLAEVAAGLPGLEQGAAAWGDVDGDGDLDLALSGRSASGRFSAVYRNDDGAFIRMTNARLTPLTRSNLAWGDMDEDGDLDLVIQGLVEAGVGPEPDSTVVEIYRNEAGTHLVMNDVRIAGNPELTVAGAYGGGVSLADFNRDGKLDLFLTGKGPELLQFRAYVYENQEFERLEDPFGRGIWRQSLRSPKLLFGAAVSAAAWGDYDQDGYADLLYNGIVTFLQPVTYLYHNDGGASFTRVELPLPQLGEGDLGWADLDTDGDLDILLTGRDADENLATALYLNEGGAFAEVTTNLPAVARSAVAFGDVDGDGDLDVLLMGDDGTGRLTRLYLNQSAAANAPPGVPTGLQAVVSDHQVTLSWNPPGDLESSTLTYQVRVSAGVTHVAPPLAGPDGTRQVVAAGHVVRPSHTLRIDSVTAYRWTVQAVDQGFAGSGFAPEQAFGRDDGISFFNVWPDVDRDILFPTSTHWVDFDADGDLDVLTDLLSRAYRNDGPAGFSRVAAGLGAPLGPDDPILLDVALGDYDSDNDPDALIRGGVLPGAVRRLAAVFRNEGGVFTEATRFSFDPGTGSEPKTLRVHWTDFDNDGQLDAFLAGSHSVSGPVVELHRNLGNGTFDLVNTAFSGGGTYRAPWVDFDRDGDLDVAEFDFGRGLRVYRNDGNATFTAVSMTGNLSPVGGTWVDYDRDGDLDLAGASGSASHLLYRTDLAAPGMASLVQAVHDPGRTTIGADALDTDNDGLWELSREGDVWTIDPSTGALQEIDYRLPHARISAAGWADYDNDGDLDALLTNDRPNLFRLYRNDSAPPNTPPSAPEGLQAVVNGTFVTLSWDAAVDDHSPSETLSYNLRIGTTPGGHDVLSPLSTPDGRRMIVRMGNANLTRRWTYELAPLTTYTWSVQALDQTHAGGPFAPEQTFTTGLPSTRGGFVNLSPDPALDGAGLRLGGGAGKAPTDDVVLVDALGFREGSPLVPVPADSAFSLLVTPAGAAEPVARFDSLMLGAGQAHLVTILGVGDPGAFAPNPDGRATALRLHVRPLTPDTAAADTARVRLYVVHGAPDVPAVDVTLTPESGPPVVLGPFSFGDAGDLVPVPAGETQILVTARSSGAELAEVTEAFSGFAGAIVPVLFSGFADPAANGDGPGLAVSSVAPNGAFITPVGIAAPPAAPAAFELAQNYPNPFNPTTTVTYTLPAPQRVSLRVYDMLGREVAVLVDERRPAGRHTVRFDARGLASGVYLYRIEAGPHAASRTMALVR